MTCLVVLLSGLLIVFGGVFIVVRSIKIYNRLVKLRALSEEGWGGVMTALKHRRGLLPKISKSAVVHAMTPASEMFRNIDSVHAQWKAARGVEETARVEASIGAALAGFKDVVEDHPDLKADGNIIQILDELSALEKRIEKTRSYYNATVRDYNMEMDLFPTKLIAGLMGFKRSAFFDPDAQ